MSKMHSDGKYFYLKVKRSFAVVGNSQMYNQTNSSLNPTSAPHSLNKLLNLIIIARLAERSGIGTIIVIVIISKQ